MPEIKKDALFIIDGSYLLYRSFYAIKPLYTSAGVQTQAIYGFCRALKKIIDDFHPQNLVVAWDSKGPTFRTALYDQYKATRQAAPSELITQKNELLELIKSVGICQVAVPGYEADDLIYSLTKDSGKRQVVLVCPDKDLFQLLGPTVLVFDPFKGRLFDGELYEKEKGLPVAKIPFFYALLGDASDNIPGVKGVGEKTALELVSQFASLDDLYANLDRVKRDRIRQLLTDQRASAELSLTLFSFKYYDLGLKADAFTFEPTWLSKAAPFFQKFEFTSFLKELGVPAASVPSGQQLTVDGTGQASEHLPAGVTPAWSFEVIDTKERLEALVAQLRAAGCFAVDTETTGYFPLQDFLVGISFAFTEHEAFYIPVGHTGPGAERQLALDLVVSVLKPLLEDASIKKVLHNAKFDYLVLLNNGITMAGIAFDTMLAANLIRNSWQKVNLKDLSQFFLGETMQPYDAIVVKPYKTIAQVPLDVVARYAAHDALQTWKFKPIFEQKLEANPAVKALFTDLDMPCADVLTEMEKAGITLDVGHLAEVGRAVEAERAQVEIKFFSSLEGVVNPLSFNLNSPKQVEWLLFDHLKLPVVKKSSKGQRSTDQEVLVELGHQSPIANLVVKYRELAKLKSTYIDALPTFVNPKTGKIHTSYSQVIAATGRLSSSNPNMQNIPTGEGFGIQIRDAFRPDAGTLFLSADYSQIELRVLAHLSKDDNLVAAFLQDRDIHAQTAAQLFGVALDQVTHAQRQVGKKINFSIMYGLTPFGLAKDLGIKPSEAKVYIEKYFAQYPKVAQWIADTVARAIEVGYVQTLAGRRREIPDLREKNKNLFEAARRMAVNTPVQGTAADIMKLAMLKVDRTLKGEGLDARLILQIHDEFLVQINPNQQSAIESAVRRQMEGVVDWSVPLKVSLRVGRSWGEVTK